MNYIFNAFTTQLRVYYLAKISTLNDPGKEAIENI